jgi:hypothetical protein
LPIDQHSYSVILPDVAVVGRRSVGKAGHPNGVRQTFA